MATVVEIESFVTKFRHLCSIGISATLNFKSKDGDTTVTLEANLGKDANCSVVDSSTRYRSPAYGRRQIKRQESRLKTEQLENNVAEEAIKLNGVNLTQAEKPGCVVKDNCNEKPAAEKEAIVLNDSDIIQTEKSIETAIREKSNKKSAEEVSFAENEKKNVSNFRCEECEFEAFSSIKLKMHIRCAHAKIENGNARYERTLNEKYKNTEHYWKTGRIGISYQSFIEANFLIDACLPQYQQVVEKDLLFEARKKQFGSNYYSYPPWCNK